jgi:hypothetical protein
MVGRERDYQQIVPERQHQERRIEYAQQHKSDAAECVEKMGETLKDFVHSASTGMLKHD